MPNISKIETPDGTTYDIRDTSKSAVSVSQITSTGTNIADITVDGVTTHLYAPSGGGGGTYTATSPIDITNDVISHEDSGVTAGTYDGGYSKGSGFYVPRIVVDAKGHITSATDLGNLIPQIGSSYAGLEYSHVVYGYQWASLPQMARNEGNYYLLSAGNTSATFSLTYRYPITSSSSDYFRVANVLAVDTTTGEEVVVDWSVDYPVTTGGKTSTITLTVSIAEAYEHTIAIQPMVAYGTAGM